MNGRHGGRKGKRATSRGTKLARSAGDAGTEWRKPACGRENSEVHVLPLHPGRRIQTIDKETCLLEIAGYIRR